MRRLTRQNVLLSILGIIPVAFLGILIAPYAKDGLFQIIIHFADVILHPFPLRFCKETPVTVLVCEVIYLLALGVYFTTAKNYRHRAEHGSAQWGVPEQVNKKYADKTGNNKILTQHVAIGINGRIHLHNLNVLIIGGPGAGKTRFYAKPNIMNANTSFVVLDPKGEILRDTGYLLERKGYNIKALDLIRMDKSHHYNPFVYLRNDDDVQRLTTNLIKNTTPKGSRTNDPFWDQAAAMLLKALVCFLLFHAESEFQNFATVMEMIRHGDVDEDKPNTKSALDVMFDQLPDEDVAKRYYLDYHSGSGKTLRSIQISLLARLEKFNLSSLQSITRDDELAFNKWDAEENPTALFAIIPDNDNSFNFIVGMLYTQLFQHLYLEADSTPDGRLKHHVHFVMDEFANVALPDDFGSLLSTMRSREISVSIIIQNMAQLKALFEKEWENIVGDCDEMLFLGGNEQSTHEYISKSLGKETIDANSYGRSRGRSGSYSTNYQILGRDLLMPNEVRKVDNGHAILLIRGEDPLLDEKYDITKHPNIGLTVDGGAPPYEHGGVKHRDYNTTPPALTAAEIDALPFTHLRHKYDNLTVEEYDDRYYKTEQKKQQEIFLKNVQAAKARHEKVHKKHEQFAPVDADEYEAALANEATFSSAEYK